MGDSWIMASFVMLSYNTGMFPLVGMAFTPAKKLYGHPVQDILPAYCEWQGKTQKYEEQAYHTLKSSEAF